LLGPLRRFNFAQSVNPQICTDIEPKLEDAFIEPPSPFLSRNAQLVFREGRRMVENLLETLCEVYNSHVVVIEKKTPNFDP
jgi:hypothetical protein